MWNGFAEIAGVKVDVLPGETCTVKVV